MNSPAALKLSKDEAFKYSYKKTGYWTNDKRVTASN